MTVLDVNSLTRYLSHRHGQPVTITSVRELGTEPAGGEALKQFGYGRPVLVTYHAGEDEYEEVFHAIRQTAFGRERDDDRVAAVWLDYHTFNLLPQHVPAVDMLGYSTSGAVRSLSELEGLLLVTTYREGALYADDFFRLRDSGEATETDLARASLVAGYLAEIHQARYEGSVDERDVLWRRRLRDLVGHGEGVMGLTDSYPQPGADAPESAYMGQPVLQELEELANAWRWRLKPLGHRLRQVHGDFHPFNILFAGEGEFCVLDRSRGPWGEPADDVSCLSINFLFFSLQRAGRLAPPFQALHERFWQRYLELRPDEELLAVVQPWLAWRALVLASPVWYPNITATVRRRLLVFAREVMRGDRYAWQDANQYLEEAP